MSIDRQLFQLQVDRPHLHTWKLLRKLSCFCKYNRRGSEWSKVKSKYNRRQSTGHMDGWWNGNLFHLPSCAELVRIKWQPKSKLPKVLFAFYWTQWIGDGRQMKITVSINFNHPYLIVQSDLALIGNTITRNLWRVKWPGSKVNKEKYIFIPSLAQIYLSTETATKLSTDACE